MAFVSESGDVGVDETFHGKFGERVEDLVVRLGLLLLPPARLTRATRTLTRTLTLTLTDTLTLIHPTTTPTPPSPGAARAAGARARGQHGARAHHRAGGAVRTHVQMVAPPRPRHSNTPPPPHSLSPLPASLLRGVRLCSSRRTVRCITLQVPLAAHLLAQYKTRRDGGAPPHRHLLRPVASPAGRARYRPVTHPYTRVHAHAHGCTCVHVRHRPRRNRPPVHHPYPYPYTPCPYTDGRVRPQGA
jgi:hypothetical protein